MNFFKKISGLALMSALLFACSSNDELPNKIEKANTYAGISIVVPGATATRASIGSTWSGRDEISSLNIYLVNSTQNTIDHESFGLQDFVITEGVLKPKKAIKATAGDNIQAYVVLNGEEELLSILKSTTASQFDQVFEQEIKKKASEVASYKNGKETVMMTNSTSPEALTIVGKISEDKALTGVANRINVTVERVVARAIVTVKDDLESNVLEVKNNKGEKVNSIKISEVTYAVGQSNSSFYNMKKLNNETPNYAGEGVSDNLGLKQVTAVSTLADNTIDNLKKALNAETTSKFVLPVTHAEDNYKKGNTTFFEVRAKFAPESVLADTKAEYTTGNLYLGMEDGLFYSTEDAAHKAVKGGQSVRTYKDGIMKYVLWLNPDQVPGTEGNKTKTSPTLRNQVYHVHITGFKEIGLPYNPLNPDEEKPSEKDPGNPIDPTDPLEMDKTYLSVEINVLDWGLNSYELNVGNDY